MVAGDCDARKVALFFLKALLSLRSSFSVITDAQLREKKRREEKKTEGGK